MLIYDEQLSWKFSFYDCDMTAPNFERTKPSVWELGFSAVKKGKTEFKRKL